VTTEDGAVTLAPASIRKLVVVAEAAKVHVPPFPIKWTDPIEVDVAIMTFPVVVAVNRSVPTPVIEAVEEAKRLPPTLVAPLET
jgi:hypothetical protein